MLQQKNFALSKLARRDAQDNPFSNSANNAQTAKTNEKALKKAE